jgi:hypothetical protein
VTDDPTFVGYQAFLTNIVGVPADQMPTDVDPNAVQFSYDFSLNMVYWWLICVPSQPTSASVYATAVYSLGADTLINYAPDIPGSLDPTYWSDLRGTFNINNFIGGVINFSSDQSTSQGIAVSDFLKNLTMADLQALKTPWGRMYLSIAQNVGTLWGLS